MRRQLTLFVPAAEARALEALRARLDPVQQGLIAAHVTRLIEQVGARPWGELERYALYALAP